MMGGTILQLNYGDTREGNVQENPRFGSHAAAYNRDNGEKNICGTGSCRTQVWCKTDDMPISCAAVLAANSTAASGTYWINPTGIPTKVYCDMENEGGGWSMVYRIAGSSEMKTTG